MENNLLLHMVGRIITISMHDGTPRSGLKILGEKNALIWPGDSPLKILGVKSALIWPEDSP